MPILVQCPNPACRVNCSVAEAISGHVKCAKCGKPFVAKPTFDGQQVETKKSQPPSNANPFPILPAEFGRYRVLRLLGKGGMGVVYLAEDSQLGRQVALKMPFFNASESPERIERFVREARSAAVLHHPNICTVFDAGQIDGRSFITMAYIAGTPLDHEIDPDVPMPQHRAAEIVRKVALALEHAHRKGTIHRDLKPANVMLAADGEPVVMDFGLAKRVETNGTNLTRHGGIVGTPSYMSPEQVNGDAQAIGPATDVYSLGVMLFEMLTGNTPYTGTGVVMMGQILTAPVPPVREFRPDVDARLDAICRKAMAKAPADRFASMAEFANALGQYLKAPASSPPPLPIPPALSVLQAPSPVIARSPFDDLDKASPPKPASKKAKWGRVVAVALALALLVPLGWWFAVVVLRAESPNGTLIVEMNDDDVEARIKNGNLILIGPEGKFRYTLTPNDRSKKLAAGSYKIRVEGADGLVLDTSEFTLKKGGEVKVRVTFEPKLIPKPPQEILATVPADALRRADIPEAVLASLGGGDPKRAPAELVAVLGDGRFRITARSYFPAFSPDGTLLAVPSGGEVFLFDVNSGQLLRRFRCRAGYVIPVAFSPNGAVLAIGDEDIVRLWNPRSGVLLQQLSGYARSPIYRVAFTPDSQTVLSASVDHTMRVWDVKTGREARVLSFKGEVRSLAITNDGRLAVASTHDGRVYGWSLDTGTEKFVLDDGNRVLTWLSVSEDGQWLASGTNDKLKFGHGSELGNKRRR